MFGDLESGQRTGADTQIVVKETLPGTEHQHAAQTAKSAWQDRNDNLYRLKRDERERAAPAKTCNELPQRIDRSEKPQLITVQSRGRANHERNDGDSFHYPAAPAVIRPVCAAAVSRTVAASGATGVSACGRAGWH